MSLEQEVRTLARNENIDKFKGIGEEERRQKRRKTWTRNEDFDRIKGH